MSHPGPALLGVLLLLRTASAQDLTILNAPLGGRVQMVPVYRGDPQGFEWKKGPNKIIEVDFPGEPQHYVLKDRSKLSLKTGVLTISDLQDTDAGSYTADVLVNGFYQHTAFQLLVFPALNKPTVSCSDTSTGVLFRCQHDPAPLTYEWFHGGEPVAAIPHNYSLTDQNRSLTIGHADRESLKSLECVVKNPASENRTSVPETCNKEDPTERQRFGPIPVWGIVLLTLLLIPLLVLVIICVCTEGVIIIITYEGKSVEMTPDFKGEPQRIEWKKGEDKIIEEEFVNKDGTKMVLMKEDSAEKGLLAKRQHRLLLDRAKVNLKTGALTIGDLQPTDSGIYTANVLLKNGKYQKTTFDLRFSPPAKHDDRLDLKEKRKKKRRYNFNRKKCLNHRTGVLTIND